MNKYVRILMIYFCCLGMKVSFATDHEQSADLGESCPYSTLILAYEVWDYIEKSSSSPHSRKENRRAILALYQTNKFFQVAIEDWAYFYKKGYAERRYYKGKTRAIYDVSEQSYKCYEERIFYFNGLYECTNNEALCFVKNEGLFNSPMKKFYFSSCLKITDFSALEGLEIEKISFVCCSNLTNLSPLLKVKNLKTINFRNTSLTKVFFSSYYDCRSDEDGVCSLSKLLPGCQINYEMNLRASRLGCTEYTYYRGYRWDKSIYSKEFNQWKKELDKPLSQRISEWGWHHPAEVYNLMCGMAIGGIILHSCLTSKIRGEQKNDIVDLWRDPPNFQVRHCERA